MSSHSTPDQPAVRRPDGAEFHLAMVVDAQTCSRWRIARISASLRVCVVSVVHGQVSQPTNPPATPDKRAFGVIPNYLTVEWICPPFQTITSGRRW
jgi:hypothetical protein